MRNWKKRSLGIFTSAAMLISAVGGFAPIAVGAVESDTVLIDENYTNVSGTAADFGWGLRDGHSASNGTITLDSSGLTVTKTGSADFGLQKTLTHTEKDYADSGADEEMRTRVWSNHIRGVFDVEFNGAFIAQGANGIFIDFKGQNVDENKSLLGIGRLKMTSDGNAVPYKNGNNNNGTSGVNFKTNQQLRLRFDTSTRQFRIFSGNSDIALSANGGDSFDMTDWNPRDKINYMHLIQVTLDAKQNSGAAYNLKGLKVTQITPANDTLEGKMDAAVAGLTIASLTDDPANVTGALNTLPDTADGAEGVTVTWSSNKPDVISNDGQTVVQGEEDEEVILTAAITDTATTYCKYKDFKLNVPSVNDPSAPAAVLSRARNALVMEQLTSENPNNITQNLTLPTEWTDDAEYGGQTVAIAWQSDNAAVIDNNGVLKMPQPTENQTVTMTATLSISGESVTKPFTFMVKQYVAGLLVEETFEGKTVTDNQVPGWSYASSSSATATNTITDGKLVMRKTSAPGSGGAESLVNQFYFRQTIEQYSDATRTESFRDTFNGKYRVEVVFRPHVTSQFCALGFLGSASNSDGTPKKPFSLCVYSNKAEIYVSQGVYFPVYAGTLNDRDNTLIYTIDTKSNDVILQINDGAPVTYTVANLTDAGYQLQGAYFAMKENQNAGDSITISSIKLYETETYETAGAEIERAMKSVTAKTLTSDPTAVTDNIDLPGEVDGVAVRWTSGNIEYMTDSGKLVERPFDEDKEVVMAGRFEKDGSVRYKNYTLTIKKEDDAEVILQTAADEITYADLTSENKDNLSQALTLPSAGKYGTVISWKSSAPEYLSDSGQIVKLDAKERKEVVMTATFSLNGKTLEKKFVFHLALGNGDAQVIYQTDFSGSEIAKNIKTINGGGTIVQENNTIKLVRTNGGDGTKIDIYPTVGGKEINMRGEFEVETDVYQPEGCAKSELVLYGSNGNRLFTLYTGQASAGQNQRYTVVARNTNGSEYRDTVTTNTKELHMKVRCQINTYTNSLNVWLDLNGAGEKQIVTNLLLREDAADLRYIEITSVNNTDASSAITNNGTLTVNGAKVSANPYSVLYLIAEDMGYAAPIEKLDGQVTQNIPLVINAWPGTEAVWSSSHPDIVSTAGIINRKALTEGTEVVLTLKIAFANQPDTYITQQFPLTIRYLNPDNLALGAKATSNAGSSAHPASKAIDGLMDTTWETARSETNPTLTIDLGGDMVINQVNLWEAEIFGKYSVQQYKVEGSRDNKNWTVLANGTTLGEGQKTHTFSPVIVRYVKYSVLAKEAGNSGLREFQVSRGDSDAATAEADLILLIDKLGSLTGLTQSVVLPNVGEYGSTLTYSSSIPAYFANNGTVIRPSETERGTLTITAEYGQSKVTRSVPISVKGTSNNNGGGGTPAGGGGGSVSSGTASGVVSYPPTDEVSISPKLPSADFGDVGESHWAYSYITTLKKKGIISGDGNNTFRPEDSISREEFLKILLGALNIQVDTTQAPEFRDVAVTDWSYPYIAAGVAAGIVNGVSDTEFGAGQSITREDISVLCDRALRYVSKQLEETSAAEEFTDGGQISDYAQDSVAQMQKYGILKGYEDGSFAPQRNASRAEAAKIIYMLAK